MDYSLCGCFLLIAERFDVRLKLNDSIFKLLDDRMMIALRILNTTSVAFSRCNNRCRCTHLDGWNGCCQRLLLSIDDLLLQIVLILVALVYSKRKWPSFISTFNPTDQLMELFIEQSLFLFQMNVHVLGHGFHFRAIVRLLLLEFFLVFFGENTKSNLCRNNECRALAQVSQTRAVLTGLLDMVLFVAADGFLHLVKSFAQFRAALLALLERLLEFLHFLVEVNELSILVVSLLVENDLLRLE